MFCRQQTDLAHKLDVVTRRLRDHKVKWKVSFTGIGKTEEKQGGNEWIKIWQCLRLDQQK